MSETSMMSCVTVTTTSHVVPDTGSTPTARRASGASWRDPRLAVGIAVIAVSVLLGARLLGGADDTVAVWAVRGDMPGGAPLGADDLVRHHVRFSSPDEANRYLSADAPVPVDMTLNRPVGAGELLPRAALGSTATQALVEVPLAVAAEAVPVTVRAGSVVDVWVTPEATTVGREARSELVFDDVPVVAIPASGRALGPSATRQVIVGIPASEQEALASALTRASRGAVVITRQG